MKKTFLFVTLASLCFITANVSHAQPVSAQEAIQSQQFSEGDVFYNVDTDVNYKALAFSDNDTEGAAKCWRVYYRPRIYYRPVWRPVYYRPYYYYYRHYCPVWYTYFTWTTITVYKGGESNGAMLDSDPRPGSVLAAQGLRKGDIITSIDGKPLSNLSDLKNVTANSRFTVQKGSGVKFAGNLLKNTDDSLAGSIDGLQEVEAGKLLTKTEIQTGDYDMYKVYDRNAGPVFGVKAAENNGSGVKVTEVMAGMPGQKAGFEEGDVILEINGTTINGEQAYSDAIDRAGSVARMKVLCGKTGQTLDVDVELNK